MDTSLTSRDNGISSIGKALAIVEFVGTKGRCRLAEIIQHTGMPRSTLLRVVGILIDSGFLRRAERGEYGIGLKLWRIGCTALDYESLHEFVVPALRTLVAETSETALYAVYDGGRAVYLEKVEGLHPIRAYAEVGGHSPAYATATGKCLLAWRHEDEIARIGEKAERFTGATRVGSKAALISAAEVRRNGFAVNRGEWRDGVWGVAAPVFGRDGLPLAAIGVTGPRNRVEPQVDLFSRAVLGAARKLSMHHGFGPSERPINSLREGGSESRKSRILESNENSGARRKRRAKT
jgi:IclR family KDG regulon transcriptional repressor